MADEIETTDDGFLGHALSILQPRAGYRAGIDAVMLAAAIPARSGELAVEAGCGVGVAALCLAHRVDGLLVSGCDAEADLVRLAGVNAVRNGLDQRVRFAQTVIGGAAVDTIAAPESADHVFANPPYHEAGRTRPSADPLKARAHAFVDGDLEAWLRAMTAALRPDGSLTVIYPAQELGRLLALLGSRVGATRIFPLFPRVGAAASRVIVQGRKGSRAPAELLPGLMLHGDGHGFTDEAEAVLRHGSALAVG